MIFSPEFCGWGLSLTVESSLVVYQNKVKTFFKVFYRQPHNTAVARTFAPCGAQARYLSGLLQQRAGTGHPPRGFS